MSKKIYMDIDELSLADMRVVLGALESWLDAFEDEQPEEAERLRKAIIFFGSIISRLESELELLRPPGKKTTEEPN